MILLFILTANEFLIGYSDGVMRHNTLKSDITQKHHAQKCSIQNSKNSKGNTTHNEYKPNTMNTYYNEHNYN
jgi:hypothetical protein